MKAISQVHFNQVSRRFVEQPQDHVGVSCAEIVDLLGSTRALGIWRLEIETGRVFWTEDAARIHGMETSSGPVSLSRILALYHPEDADLVEQLLGSATTQHDDFSFVMRVEDGLERYRLIAVAGRYRDENGGELVGLCHEFHEMVRSVVLASD